MSSGNLYSDLILLRRHYANFRKDVMQAEALPPHLDVFSARGRKTLTKKILTNVKRAEAARAELDALSRSIKRLESDRWQSNGRKKR